MTIDQIKSVFGLQGIALKTSKEYQGKPSLRKEFWFTFNDTSYVLTLDDDTLSAIQEGTDQLSYGLHARTGCINLSIYLSDKPAAPVVMI